MVEDKNNKTSETTLKHKQELIIEAYEIMQKENEVISMSIEEEFPGITEGLFLDTVKNGIDDEDKIVESTREPKKNEKLGVRIALSILLAMVLSLYIFSGKIKNWIIEQLEKEYNSTEETGSIINDDLKNDLEEKLILARKNIK